MSDNESTEIESTGTDIQERDHDPVVIESSDAPKEIQEALKDDTHEKKPEDEGDAEKKPKSRSQARIERLANQKREERLRRIEAEERIMMLEQKLAEQSKPSDKEPDPDDYETWDDYNAALEAFEKGDKKGEGEGEEAEKVTQHEFNRVLESLQDDFDRGRDRYPDFDRLVQADDLAITPSMVMAIRNTEEPEEVTYYLANNPGEAARIAIQNEHEQLRSIYRLESRLGSPPPQAETPKPINPVGGNERYAPNPMDEKSSFKEYENHRMQQLKKRKFGW